MHRLPSFLKNRYSLVLLFLITYITFFDAHDLISQIKIKSDIRQMEEEIEFLEGDTEKAEKQIRELTTNKASLEKFAREQYRMKRENEEIFVIIKEEKE
jgi:cell division protein FtsB